MDKLTLAEALLCDFVWLSALIFFYCKTYNSSNAKKTTGYFGLWLFIALYSTFEFTGGDFFHYKELYTDIIKAKQSIHMEDFYCWLALNLPSSFYIWRFFVWGMAAFFWILTLRNLKQDVYFAGLWFVLVAFFLFVGARQALCFSVQYYAVSLLFREKHISAMSVVVAIAILWASLFLHKTAIVYVLVITLAFLPIGKRSVLLSVILFPLLYIIFDQLTANFIQYYSFYNEGNAATMERYMNGENLEANFNGMIRQVINRLPILILLAYSLKKVYFVKYAVDNKLMKVLLNISYMLIYISSLFSGRDVSGFIAPRFWDAAYFPLTLFLSSFLFENKKDKIIKLSINLLIISQLYTIAYTIYKL